MRIKEFILCWDLGATWEWLILNIYLIKASINSFDVYDASEAVVHSHPVLRPAVFPTASLKTACHAG
jgi:hypothetical protein